MGITLGFSDGGDGFLGSLGRSIAGATSPANTGFTDSIRGFLNPGPVLGEEARTRALGVLGKAYDQAEPLIQNAFKAMEAGDRQAGLLSLYQAQAVLQRNGLPPDDFAVKTLDSLAKGYDQATLRSMDPNSADYLPKLGSLLSSPEEGMNLAKTMQGQRESTLRQAGLGLQNQGLEQDITQKSQLFPGELQGQGLRNNLTQSQIQTQAAQQAEMALRGGLLGSQTEGSNIGNEFERAKMEQFKETGYLPSAQPRPLSSMGSTTQEGKHASAIAKAIAAIANGRKGPLGRPMPYGVDEASQMVAPYNAMADTLEQQTGRPQPRVVIERAPDTQGVDDQGKPYTIPGGARPRMVMGRQEQQGPAPLTPESLAKIPDEQVRNLAFDERTLTPQDRQTIYAIRREAQAALRAAPPERQAEIAKFYNRKVLEALAGGAPNANNR